MIFSYSCPCFALVEDILKLCVDFKMEIQSDPKHIEM